MRLRRLPRAPLRRPTLVGPQPPPLLATLRLTFWPSCRHAIQPGVARCGTASPSTTRRTAASGKVRRAEASDASWLRTCFRRVKVGYGVEQPRQCARSGRLSMFEHRRQLSPARARLLMPPPGNLRPHGAAVRAARTLPPSARWDADGDVPAAAQATLLERYGGVVVGVLWVSTEVDRQWCLRPRVPQAMLQGLLARPELHPLLPYARQFHCSDSSYTWVDGQGTSHAVAQGEGGE